MSSNVQEYRAEAVARATPLFASASGQLAVLAGNGDVLATNGAWLDYAMSRTGRTRRCRVGDNYVDFCEHGAGRQSPESNRVLGWLRAVQAGLLQSAYLEYATEADDGRRWFACRIFRIGAAPDGLFAVHHEEVSAVLASAS